MALNDLKKRIQALQRVDIPAAMQELIMANQEVLIELLHIQMESGLSGNEEPIMLNGEPEYRWRTIKYKRRYGSGPGAITDRITLYMFGEFWNTMFVEAEGASYSVRSPVSYFDKIIARSGPDVMKLNKESMDIFMRYYIVPGIHKIVSDAVNGDLE